MLLIIFGPPAAGKMTVGSAVCEASDFRLFYNHMTIEPLLETFGYGSAPFNVLNGEFRRRVIEEARAAELDLIFTYVWALDCADDLSEIEQYVRIFDGDVAFVELRSDLVTRLERHRTPQRLAAKASKRDVTWSDDNVHEMESQWTMTSASGRGRAENLLSSHPHLVIDNTSLTPADTAQQILAWLATARGANPQQNWEKRVAEFWQSADDSQPAAMRDKMRGLVDERPADDPAALFEWASMHDFLGQEGEAIPLYEKALSRDLAGERQWHAVMQLASSLRNIGQAERAVEVLDGFDFDEVTHPAASAFRALALHDCGRTAAALREALLALAPTLPAYSGAIKYYAEALTAETGTKAI